MVLTFAENSRQLLSNSVLKADPSFLCAHPNGFVALLLSPGKV